MPLHVGTWDIFAGGSQGKLIITADGSGGFTGTAFGLPIVGLFDETSQTFRFLLTNAGQAVQSYSGTQFMVMVGVERLYTLAGLFEVFPVTPAGGFTTGPTNTNTFTWIARNEAQLIPIPEGLHPV
jgi:hypothetical protein